MGYNFLLKRLVFCYMALYGLCWVSCRKTIILVGPSGVGKSTIGNCLLNKDASINATQHYPFATKNGANGCTTNSIWHTNDAFVVIDTVGFGDPTISSQESFRKFQRALATVNNSVDAVIFLMKDGRLTNELVDFFKLFQDDVFKGRMRRNSILICSKCEKGWLQKNRERNTFLNELINKCSNHSLEFKLNFEVPAELTPDEREFVMEMNEAMRNESIGELVQYLNGLTLCKVHLGYVQSSEFEKLFVGEIIPRMQMLDEQLSEMIRTLAGPYADSPYFNKWYIKAGGVVLISGVSIYGMSIFKVPSIIPKNVRDAILRRFWAALGTARDTLMPHAISAFDSTSAAARTILQVATNSVVMCRSNCPSFLKKLFGK